MAGLTTESKANLAFKRLIGKAHTSNATPFFSESIPSQIWISYDEILGQSIPTDPQTAVNQNVAEFVECELVEIQASNGLAYDIVFPSGYSGSFNASQGDLVRDYTQVVAKKNNLQDGPANSSHTGGYVYDLKDGGNSIAVTAAENWQVDPVSAIVVSESPLNLGSDGTIALYLYTGDFLDDVITTSIQISEDQLALGDSSGNIDGTPDLTLDEDVSPSLFTVNAETVIEQNLTVNGNFGFDQGTEVSVISTDSNLGGNTPSDDNLATQKAIKAYVDQSTDTTDDVPEGSSNLYYTDERVDDRVANLIQTGTDLTSTYDDVNNTLTLEVADTIDLGTL